MVALQKAIFNKTLEINNTYYLTSPIKMYGQKKIIAIIAARGGSKRLPRKNILDLKGKPLIVWSIIAGIKSKYIDKVVVTSDNSEILEISTNAGAEIIRRPSEFSGDKVAPIDAVLHAINTITNMSQYDYVILLQPTSPLRTAAHIDDSIELLFSKKADAVVSVCQMEHSPLWSNTLPPNSSMNTFFKDEVKRMTRSQDLDKYYRLNGAIYICKLDKLKKEKSFFLEDNIFAYKMNIEDSIDIDSSLDFKLAEFMASIQ